MMSESPPKARKNLRISEHESPEGKYFIISASDTAKYIKLREPEFLLLHSLNGKRSIEEIRQELVRVSGIEIDIPSIVGFIDKLGSIGLLEGSKERDERQSGEAESGRRRSLFYVRFKAFNPEKLINWLHGKSKFLFSPLFSFSSAILVLFGLYVVASLPGSVPYSAIDMLKVSTILGFIVALFVVVVVHEFSHAVVCRHYGGQVTEMGFLLIYFQPAIYCNLSDSYMFPKKSQRVYTILAGIYFQLVLGSAAIIVWRITRPGTISSDLLFIIAAVSFGTLIFNLNPLLKLDGYYFLAEATDITNLRGKAFRYLRRVLTKIAFGIEYTGAQPSPREKRIFLLYSLASIAYTAILFYYLGGLLLSALLDKWHGNGFLLFVAIVAAVFGPPLSRAISRFRNDVMEDAIARASFKRIAWWIIILIIIVLILVLVPAELRVSSPARINPIESLTISIPEEGILKSVYMVGGAEYFRKERVCQLASADFSVFRLEPRVADGVHVRAGDTLLSVSENLYAGQLAEVEKEIKKVDAELNLLLADPKAEAIAEARAEVERAKSLKDQSVNEYVRILGLFDEGLVPKEEWESARTSMDVAEQQVHIAESRYELLKSGPRAEEIAVKDAEREQLAARADYLREQVEASIFTAPFDGVVISTDHPKQITRLVRTDTVEVRITVPQQDLDVVEPGQRAMVKLSSYPTQTFDGEVVKVREFGDGGAGDASFEAVTLLANADGLLRPGMTGYGKIYCGKRSLLGLLIRGIARFFRVEFWSWW
jgi:putative peptide zinc metalloprotease protein